PSPTGLNRLSASSVEPPLYSGALPYTRSGSCCTWNSGWVKGMEQSWALNHNGRLVNRIARGRRDRIGTVRSKLTDWRNYGWKNPIRVDPWFNTFTAMLSARTRFPNLDGLRFLAAALVVADHLEHSKHNLGLPHNGDLAHWSMLGHLGVLLFFVLSGFLITYLLLEEEQRTGRIHY